MSIMFVFLENFLIKNIKLMLKLRILMFENLSSCNYFNQFLENRAEILS